MTTAEIVEASEPRSSSGREPLSSSERTGVLAGTYRLIARIGAGGMGEVYEAEHVRLERRFAVKFLCQDPGGQARARFAREIRAAARIENEHVVSVVDCGEASDGVPYLVMELLRGEDLRQLLERASPLPIPRAVKLVLEACRGIEAVHASGAVHRDLKPENLFVAKRASGEDWCKVLDFGVAKMDASSATAEGSLVGTVKYMAPEQLADGASVGPRADVYALGAILYECLAGEPPYRAPRIPELMFKIINEPARPLSAQRAGVPSELEAAILRALAKRAEDRFATVADLARVLTPFSSVRAREDRASEVTAPIEPPRVARPKKSTLALVSLVVGIFFAGGAVGVLTAASRAAAAPEPSLAAGPPVALISAVPAVAPLAAESPASPVTSEPTAAPAAAALPAASSVGAPTKKQPSKAHASMPTRFDLNNPYR